MSVLRWSPAMSLNAARSSGIKIVKPPLRTGDVGGGILVWAGTERRFWTECAVHWDQKLHRGAPCREECPYCAAAVPFAYHTYLPVLYRANSKFSTWLKGILDCNSGWDDYLFNGCEAICLLWATGRNQARRYHWQQAPDQTPPADLWLGTDPKPVLLRAWGLDEAQRQEGGVA